MVNRTWALICFHIWSGDAPVTGPITSRGLDAGTNLNNAVLASVYLGVDMDRHVGFLTATSALGRKFLDDGPRLTYPPERTFVFDKFLTDVNAIHERYGRCVIAVSEGIHDARASPVTALLVKDLVRDAPAGLLCEEIKSQLKIRRIWGDAFRLYPLPMLRSGRPDAFRLCHHPVVKVLNQRGKSGFL